MELKVELYIWSRKLNTEFVLTDYLLAAVTLTRSADPDNYFYSGCVTGFNSGSFI